MEMHQTRPLFSSPPSLPMSGHPGGANRIPPPQMGFRVSLGAENPLYDFLMYTQPPHPGGPPMPPPGHMIQPGPTNTPGMAPRPLLSTPGTLYMYNYTYYTYTYAYAAVTSASFAQHTTICMCVSHTCTIPTYVYMYLHTASCVYVVGGLQAFPPVNIAPDINMDLAPPMAKKVRSEADDLVPEQQFIAEHPVRIKSTKCPLCVCVRGGGV